MGGLSRDQVRRTIRQHIHEVRCCHEAEEALHPDLEVRVSVRLSISAAGAVQTADVDGQANALTEVGACIAQTPSSS